MSEDELLLHSIVLDPAENTPRLVYADWLQEHGQHDRAEFIRDQIEFRPGSNDFDLLNANWEAWFPDVKRRDERGFNRCKSTGGIGVPLLNGNIIIFSRGFVSAVCFSRTESYLRHASDGYWKHQPVAYVQLLDKFPVQSSGGLRFWLGDIIRGADTLPMCLYEIIVFDLNNGSRYFATRDAARHALSEACVIYGRKQAGLPPLPRHEGIAVGQGTN